VIQVLERLRDAGHRSWLVGGVVRDLLVRRARPDPAEFDVATPATPAEVTPLFRRVVPTGIEHGTVTVIEGGCRIEITTFRGEGPYVDGRRPSSVTFHTDLEADLARRDFTVNALAWDPLPGPSGEFRDPFGGVDDVRRGLIRAVGDPRARFEEDGLRPLRAVRFAAQHGARLEPGTHAAIRPALPVVRRVSRERVAEELSRLLVAPHADRGLELLEETGLLGLLVPGLARLRPAARRHAVAVASAPFRAAGREPERLRLLRLAGLLHPLAPAEAREEVLALRLPNRAGDGVRDLLAAGPCLRAPRAPLPRSPRDVRRWLSGVGPGRVADLLALWAADASHQGARSRRLGSDVRALRRRAAAVLAARPPLATGDLALRGREVMAVLGTGGPTVGEALRHLLDRVLDDPARNEPAVLESELRAWWGARPPFPRPA
jgi:tRNA nucleotidyltransferase (CCA-adding enzyme)